MARIVTGGRSGKVIERTRYDGGVNKMALKRYATGDKGTDVAVCGVESILQVENDLALVKQYFDLNTSRAFRLALRLTAKAIRAGKLQL